MDRIHGLGMQFGLWFEPEMVNPDSDLYREHPDWILSAEGRVPLQHRNQLVLDLTNPEVWTYLRDRIDAILGEHSIDYVKWDHNRDLLEAGSARHEWAPGAHAQSQAYYALLDDLRGRHPARALGVVRRRWRPDRPRRDRAGAAFLDLGHDRCSGSPADPAMDGAVRRPGVPRRAHLAPSHTRPAAPSPWTSAPPPRSSWPSASSGTSPRQARRTSNAWLSGARFTNGFGPSCTPGERSGSRRGSGPASPRGRGPGPRQRHRLPRAARRLHAQPRFRVRVPGLDPDAAYRLSWLGPVDLRAQSMSVALSPDGPTGGAPVQGGDLERIGFWMPRRAPHTATLVHVQRTDDEARR